MRHIKKFRYELLIFVFWAGATAAKLKYNGLILGFDYGIYQPDGKFYTYMALEYINHNPAQSAQQVVDWYANHGFKMNIFTIQDLMPETSFAYSTISHRVLYPILSVPFVALFGVPGMLAIPTLSLLFLLLSIQKLARLYDKSFIGFALALVLLNSETVLRWMVVNCTDALLVGLFAAVPLLLLKMQERKRDVFFSLSILIVLTSATRFILPVWLAIFGVLLIKNVFRKEVFSMIVLCIVSAGPALSAQLSTALLVAEVDTPTYLKLLKLPISYLKVVGIDVLQFGVMDRILLILLTFTFVQSIRLREKLSSAMFISVLFAGYLIGAINGTLGVNFRYQMPVLVFCAWVVIDSFELKHGSLHLVPSIKRNVIVNKAQ